MRRLLATALLATVGHALAQEPGDFRASAPLETQNGGPAWRVVLPEAVHRLARPDLADVRVFNARGEPVPIALAGEPEKAREPRPALALPAFAVARLESAAPGGPQVSIRVSDGTLVAVDGQGRNVPPEEKTRAWILDASAAKEPLQALALDWDASAGAGVVQVRVEGSDDLRAWRSLSALTPLVRLEQDGRTLEQAKVPLAGTAKYLRLTWEGPALRLRAARGELAETVTATGRLVKTVTGTPGDKRGEILFDLGGALPVEAVRLVPAQPNSVVPATLFTRDARGREEFAAAGVFHRVAQGGGEAQPRPLEVGRRSARRWVARYDPDKAGLGERLPSLEVAWRPAGLVFLGRGDGPYRLAFGLRDARSALQPVTNLIPGYEPHAEAKLPIARLGELREQAALAGHWPEWLADVPPRQFALWAVLVAAVGLLGVLAWRLHGQIAKPD